MTDARLLLFSSLFIQYIGGVLYCFCIHICRNVNIFTRKKQTLATYAMQKSDIEVDHRWWLDKSNIFFSQRTSGPKDSNGSTNKLILLLHLLQVFVPHFYFDGEKIYNIWSENYKLILSIFPLNAWKAAENLTSIKVKKKYPHWVNWFFFPFVQDVWQNNEMDTMPLLKPIKSWFRASVYANDAMFVCLFII